MTPTLWKAGPGDDPAAVPEAFPAGWGRRAFADARPGSGRRFQMGSREGVRVGPGRPSRSLPPWGREALWRRRAPADYRWLREEGGSGSFLPEGPGWVAERVASVLQGGIRRRPDEPPGGASGGPFGFFGFIGSSPGVDGIPTPMRFSTKQSEVSRIYTVAGSFYSSMAINHCPLPVTRHSATLSIHRSRRPPEAVHDGPSQADFRDRLGVNHVHAGSVQAVEAVKQPGRRFPKVPYRRQDLNG